MGAKLWVGAWRERGMRSKIGEAEFCTFMDKIMPEL
jgi:hypothetical protein